MSSNHGHNPILVSGGVCPVSGLPVFEGADWHLADPNSLYRIRLCRIGDQILIRYTTGSANGHDAEMGSEIHQAVEASLLKTRDHYIQIEDFSGLSGFNMAARRAYIKHFENRPHLRGLIFCGVSSIMSMSIRIACKLYAVKFPVRVVGSYEEAITCALDLLAEGGLQSDANSISPEKATDFINRDILSFFKTDSSVDMESNPDWIIFSEEYRAEYHIINGHIILAVVEGYFQHQHIELTLEMQRRLLAKLDASRGDFHIIADVSGLAGISFLVRAEYIRAQNRFHSKHPYQSLIFCGASKSIRAAIYLGRPIARFEVGLAENVKKSLQHIISRRTEAGITKPTAAVTADSLESSRVLDDYVEDVLHYLGNLSIKSESMDYQPIEFQSNHPFSPVFEAIDLIYDDINELIDRRIQDEKEKRELEQKLAVAQKMEALGLLAGGVAHDLNNVLSGITTYPETLLLSMPQDHPLRKPLQTIRESGESAAAIVEDLLTLTRRGTNPKTVLNLNTIVEKYIDSPEHASLCHKYPDLRVSMELDSDLPNLKGSAVHLTKMLMNLILNGAEAQEQTPKQQMKIVTDHCYFDTLHKGFMDIPVGEYVQLKVRDSGVGIESQHINRIFEPFYTRKVMGHSGTGLGMTVVWGTVQDHEAYLDIQTRSGSGTTFSIYFPICRDDIKEEEQTAVLEKLDRYRGKGQTILVIDDVPNQREIASAILRRLGYSVSTVSSGEEAIEHLKYAHMNLLLLDMEMAPGMDGYQTYKEIIKFKPGQRAVIASGFSENEKVRKIKALGVGHFIKKPYSIEILSKTVYNALHTY